MSTKSRKRYPLSRRRVRKVAVESPPDAITEPSLQKFWLEKFRFNVSKLRLDKDRARAWATRAVLVKVSMIKTELE
jgi:hypothetical protein